MKILKTVLLVIMLFYFNLFVFGDNPNIPACDHPDLGDVCFCHVVSKCSICGEPDDIEDVYEHYFSIEHCVDQNPNCDQKSCANCGQTTGEHQDHPSCDIEHPDKPTAKCSVEPKDYCEICGKTASWEIVEHDMGNHCNNNPHCGMSVCSACSYSTGSHKDPCKPADYPSSACKSTITVAARCSACDVITVYSSGPHIFNMHPGCTSSHCFLSICSCGESTGIHQDNPPDDGSGGGGGGGCQHSFPSSSPCTKTSTGVDVEVTKTCDLCSKPTEWNKTTHVKKNHCNLAACTKFTCNKGCEDLDATCPGGCSHPEYENKKCTTTSVGIDYIGIKTCDICQKPTEYSEVKHVKAFHCDNREICKRYACDKKCFGGFHGTTNCAHENTKEIPRVFHKCIVRGGEVIRKGRAYVRHWCEDCETVVDGNDIVHIVTLGNAVKRGVATVYAHGVGHPSTLYKKEWSCSDGCGGLHEYSIEPECEECNKIEMEDINEEIEEELEEPNGGILFGQDNMKIYDYKAHYVGLYGCKIHGYISSPGSSSLRSGKCVTILFLVKFKAQCKECEIVQKYHYYSVVKCYSTVPWEVQGMPALIALPIVCTVPGAVAYIVEQGINLATKFLPLKENKKYCVIEIHNLIERQGEQKIMNKTPTMSSQANIMNVKVKKNFKHKSHN